MSYLVTGSEGFVGTRFKKLLQDHGIECMGVDKLGEPSCLRMDIGGLNPPAEQELLAKAMRQARVLVHLAAVADVEKYEKAPDLLGDTLRNVELVCRLAVHEGRPLVYVSSASVYGLPQRAPMREDHPLRPINVYGLSKKLGEEICRYYAATRGLRVAIVRFFNLYGPGQDRARTYSGTFVTRHIQKLSKMRLEAPASGPVEQLHVSGISHTTRDFIYVDDACEALLRVTEALAKGLVVSGEAVNVAYGEAVTLGEVLETLCLLMHFHPRIEFDGIIKNDPGVKGRAPFYADVTRLKALGWSPKYNLTTGLQVMLNSGVLVA